MKLKNNDIVIPEDGSNPFINCKLDRKKYADILTNIVESYADGFVLAINNPWGEGKTTFVKMWRQDMINNGFQTLYYNAWENDFENDVLIALISELGELKNKPEQKFKDVLKKVVPLTSSLLPSIGKHLAKRLVGDEAVEDLIETIGEYTEDQLKEATKKYSSRKKSIQDFKDSLESFVNEAGNGKPIVFMIDELDRCRPNYAVEVLEQIKHLFSVPGIVFVLSIDKIQLGYAVRGVYGSENIDADEYLRRFIDLEYVIPEPNKRQLVDYFYDYFSFNEFFLSSRQSHLKHEASNFKNFASAIIKGKEINLRRIEKLFSASRVALKTVNPNDHLFPDLFLLLIFLKINKREIFSKIKEKVFDVQQLIFEIESIFQNVDDQDQPLFIYAIVNLAVAYHNYRYFDIYPFLPFDIEKYNNPISINLKSKFDKTENNRDLLNSYVSLKRYIIVERFNILPILNRIELLDPIVS